MFTTENYISFGVAVKIFDILAYFKTLLLQQMPVILKCDDRLLPYFIKQASENSQVFHVQVS